MFFRDVRYQSLQRSNLYILSAGFTTLKKLELINSILVKDKKWIIFKMKYLE